jgi:hypothetical protein
VAVALSESVVHLQSSCVGSVQEVLHQELLLLREFVV